MEYPDRLFPSIIPETLGTIPWFDGNRISSVTTQYINLTSVPIYVTDSTGMVMIIQPENFPDNFARNYPEGTALIAIRRYLVDINKGNSLKKLRETLTQTDIQPDILNAPDWNRYEPVIQNSELLVQYCIYRKDILVNHPVYVEKLAINIQYADMPYKGNNVDINSRAYDASSLNDDYDKNEDHEVKLSVKLVDKENKLENPIWFSVSDTRIQLNAMTHTDLADGAYLSVIHNRNDPLVTERGRVETRYYPLEKVIEAYGFFSSDKTRKRCTAERQAVFRLEKQEIDFEEKAKERENTIQEQATEIKTLKSNHRDQLKQLNTKHLNTVNEKDSTISELKDSIKHLTRDVTELRLEKAELKKELEDGIKSAVATSNTLQSAEHLSEKTLLETTNLIQSSKISELEAAKKALEAQVDSLKASIAQLTKEAERLRLMAEEHKAKENLWSMEREHLKHEAKGGRVESFLKGISGVLASLGGAAGILAIFKAVA